MARDVVAQTKMDGEVEAGNMDLAVPGAGNRMKWVKKIGRTPRHATPHRSGGRGTSAAALYRLSGQRLTLKKSLPLRIPLSDTRSVFLSLFLCRSRA